MSENRKKQAGNIINLYLKIGEDLINSFMPIPLKLIWV